MDRPYFCAYHSYLEALEPLNDAEKGRLFVACLTYSMTGEVPQLSGNERFVFPSLRGQIDRDKARFAELDRKQAENGRKGGRPRKKPKEPENEEESSSKPKKPTAFSENPKNPPVFLETQKSQEKDIEIENKKKIAAKAATKEKTKNPPDGGLPLPPPSEGECPHPSPEATWLELGLGQRIGKALKDMLDEFRQAGISDTVIAAAMREAAEYEAKAPLPYVRRILEQCQAYGIFTAQDWKASHKGNRGSKRVDRATPSGNDFLADALNRPRRHKRTG